MFTNKPNSTILVSLQYFLQAFFKIIFTKKKFTNQPHRPNSKVNPFISKQTQFKEKLRCSRSKTGKRTFMVRRGSACVTIFPHRLFAYFWGNAKSRAGRGHGAKKITKKAPQGSKAQKKRNYFLTPYHHLKTLYNHPFNTTS